MRNTLALNNSKGDVIWYCDPVTKSLFSFGRIINHKPSKTQRLFASVFLDNCQYTFLATIFALRASWWHPHWLLLAEFLLSSCAWIAAFWITFYCRSFCQEMIIGVQSWCHCLGVVGEWQEIRPVPSSCFIVIQSHLSHRWGKKSR